MKQLRELGLRIAIDDLGTGFSSLSRLRDLPIDLVKIDRSFVAEAHLDAAGEAIVKAIVGMAHALGLQVVAKGGETEEQLALVERQGCHLVQGFLFYHPLHAHELESLLVDSRESGSRLDQGSTQETEVPSNRCLETETQCSKT